MDISAAELDIAMSIDLLLGAPVSARGLGIETCAVLIVHDAMLEWHEPASRYDDWFIGLLL